jgi:integrase
MTALDQAAAVIKAAVGTRIYIPVLLALTTGMRRGELLGLRWRDVDLEAGTATVMQALEHTRTGFVFKPRRPTAAAARSSCRTWRSRACACTEPARPRSGCASVSARTSAIW